MIVRLQTELGRPLRELALVQRVPALLSTLGLSLLLCLGLKSDSLWTDEAFSAFIACHRNLSLLWQTLLHGDSSDLQMWLYYCYLHLWVALFGDRELVFRAANIPFIVIYSFAIVWTRNQLFRSNWVWVAVLSPFVWAYSADARPYMGILALSTVVVLCMVASVTDPRFGRSRALPWIGLSAMLLGLNLHMLMVLLIPVSFIFVFTYRFTSGTVDFRRWISPALILAPFFLIYFVFLAWTFGRGTNYDYARPDLLSMGSVLFRFAGLAGYAPNRHYAVAFGPYVPGMVLAAMGMIGAGLIALGPALRARHARTISLAAAAVAGICEALVLSLVFRQQIEVRHLACLFAIVLFLFFSAWESARGIDSRHFASISVIVISLIWLISDWRMTFLPEYRREDFRGAVAETLNLAQDRVAEIAVVADPAAAAYYGLSMRGGSPCFPLPGTCESALQAVTWPKVHRAILASFWTPEQIKVWLRNGEAGGDDRVVLISRSRHPMYADSAWWPELRNTKSYIAIPFHGFFVYTRQGQKY